MSPSDDPGVGVWLVAGASTGIGRAVAESLAVRGTRVMAAARNPVSVESLAQAYPEHVQACALDVLDDDSVRRGVDATIAAFGQIDVVLNCAGVGLAGSVEESSVEEIRRLLETNLLGAHRVIRAVLPHMRARRSGRIAVITSQGAFQGQAGCAPYCASKAAANALLEGLALELEPLGIEVTIVEPGLVATNFHGGAIHQAARRIDDYRATCDALRDAVTLPYPATAHDVDLAAAAIVTGLTRPRPPRHLALGADALAMIRAKLRSVGQELDAWETVSLQVTSLSEG